MRLRLMAGIMLVSSACAQDAPEFFDTHPAALDSAHFERVFQNSLVEVIRVRLGPHEKTASVDLPGQS